jgi:hypothetical protein
MDETAATHAMDAEALAGRYDAWAWVAYAAMFLVIPFVVLVFRLHMHAWHYFLAGGMFLAFAALFFAMDGAATRVREGEGPR